MILPGPAGDQRHPDAALVHIALVAAQRPVAVVEIGIRAALLVRPVVAGEQHQRLVVKAQPLQTGEQPADVAIHARNHGGMPLLRVGPVLVRVGTVGRHFHALLARLVVRVGDREGQVEEERLILVPLDELQGLRREQIVRVLDALRRDAAGRVDRLDLVGQQYLLLVAPEVVGIVVVGVGLIQVAEPVIEALLVRNARRLRLAEAPLADDAGRVAGPLEQLGHGDIRRPQRNPVVAANPGMSRVQPGHQAAPRRRTDRAAGVVIREDHPLGRHAVQIRRLNRLLPIAAQVPIPQIVGQNEDDIGLLCRRPRFLRLPRTPASRHERRDRPRCRQTRRLQESSSRLHHAVSNELHTRSKECGCANATAQPFIPP